MNDLGLRGPEAGASPGRFVILGRYRSGSTLLARTLQQHPALRVQEEIFNLNNLARDPTILADPSGFLARALVAGGAERMVGFKLMYEQATRLELDPAHWAPGPTSKILASIATIEVAVAPERGPRLDALERIWEDLRRDRWLRVVHLVRQDYLAGLVSYVRAMRDDRWIDAPYTTRTVRLAPELCLRWFESSDALIRRYGCVFSEHAVHPVTYESLVARFDETIGEVLEFLGASRLRLAPGTSRQRDREPREAIENYDELRAHFRGGPWSGLFA